MKTTHINSIAFTFYTDSEESRQETINALLAQLEDLTDGFRIGYDETEVADV